MTDTRNDDPLGVDTLRSPSPSPGLEQKTVDELRSLGLVRPRATLAWLVTAAAFVLGVALGTTGATANDPDYVLLLVGGETGVSESETDTRVQEYARWASKLRDDGVGVSGERLTGDVRSVRGAAGSEHLDVRGFFLIEAPTEELAREIAESCPHLRYGGDVLLGRLER